MRTHRTQASHPSTPRAAFERLENRRLMAATIPTIVQTNLVSDNTTIIPAAHADANLKNSWGLAITSTGNVWVADNGTGTSTVYDQTGAAVLSGSAPLVVTIPPPAGGLTSTPTGTVQHKGTGFNVSANGKTGASSFMFATEDGTISGWNPTVDATHALLVVDHSSTGDVFKGLAQIGSGKSARIFATDFHGARIEAFDSSFAQVTLASGAFTDPQIPAGFAPFGIQAIGSKLYVTYALQNATMQSDVAGVGNGFVDTFNRNGKLLKRVASNGTLNSPWGVATAPSSFRKFSGDILVGNFGDGHVNVFSKSNKFLGQLTVSGGATLTIDGLWSLMPGVKTARKELLFTAGPNGEADGLLGTLAGT
ncbi:MAG TPA: TIGR03118 family protein [Tepidisphaeraceae bacterium]|jgi:uncharacterized protein (TIGR03118 family)|nr:TIGR03118 family protein [Tepidisphaeraceae bacterium]